MVKKRTFKLNNSKDFSLTRKKNAEISVNQIKRKNLLIGVSLIVIFTIFPLIISEDVKIATSFSGTIGSQAWAFDTGGGVYSDPTLGDVDGDGDMEVLVSSNNKVHCLNGANGAEEWTFTIENASQSGLALGDVDGDGDIEVLVSSNNKVHCLNGANGAEEWAFRTGGLIDSNPALGDVDKDGDMEIVVGSHDKKIYCLDGTTGVEEWTFITGNIVFSSPVLGDVDGDGNMEIVVGSYDNKIYCLDGTTGIKEWIFTTEYGMWSNPALGDVDGDGDMEIVVGSSDNKVYCLDGTTGIKEWVFKTGRPVYSSSVLGDVDRDGDIEVIVGSYDNKVYCLDGTNGNKEWEFLTGNVIKSSPALGDIDGDGGMEVVVGSCDNKVYCLNGTTGVEEWTFKTGGGQFSPALGDVDGDGDMEIVVGSYGSNVYCLVGKGDPWRIPGPWPCQGGSALHHSNANDKDGDNLPDILEISLGLNENKSDTDNDGMPDGWEIQYSLNPFSNTDADTDPDGDGLANLQEFQQGSNPHNSDTDLDGFPDNFDPNPSSFFIPTGLLITVVCLLSISVIAIKISQKIKKRYEVAKLEQQHQVYKQYIKQLIEISPKTAEEAIEWLNKIKIEVDKFLIQKRYDQALPLLKTKNRIYNFAITSFNELGLSTMVPPLENERVKNNKLLFNTFLLTWVKNYEVLSKKLEENRENKNFEEVNKVIKELIIQIDIRINFAKELNIEDDVKEFILIKEQFDTIETVTKLSNQYKQLEVRYNDLVALVESGELTSAITESKELKNDIEEMHTELRTKSGMIQELTSLVNTTNTLLERLDRFNSDINSAFQAKLKGLSPTTIDLSRISAQIILPEIAKIRITDINIPLYAKIVLLGESSVGKTHLVLSMTEAEYSPTQGSTVGVDKYYIPVKLPIEGYDPQLCFWDLGGQWNFRAVNELFLNEASVILLVFDMTRPETFSELEYWMEMVKTIRGSQDKNIIVIGNKIDVGGSAVASGQINEFLEVNKIKRFYKTSALTKQNISVLLEDIAGTVDWSSLMKEVPPDVLSSVENELKDLRKHTKIFMFTDLMAELENRLRNIDPILLKVVLKKNAAQEIVQFGRSELFIILDPEKIDKAIAKIIGKAAESNGMVNFDEINELKSLRVLDKKQKKLLMKYLENENVCYTVRDTIWLFPHVIHRHENEIKADQLTLEILNSEPTSGGIKFNGPGDLIFTRFTVLVAQELGVPENVSNIAVVWKIGGGHNITALMGQFIPSPSGGVIRLKAGGAQGSKQYERIFEILQQTLSTYASKFENI